METEGFQEMSRQLQAIEFAYRWLRLHVKLPSTLINKVLEYCVCSGATLFGGGDRPVTQVINVHQRATGQLGQALPALAGSALEPVGPCIASPGSARPGF